MSAPLASRLGLTADTPVYSYVWSRCASKEEEARFGPTKRLKATEVPEGASRDWTFTLGQLMRISGYTVFRHGSDLLAVRRSLDTLEVL